MKVVGNETTHALVPDHPDELVGWALLAQALGTVDIDFMHGLLEQLGNVSSKEGKSNELMLNFMISVVKDIKPRDQIEAMLAAQMAAVHMATMTSARQLAGV